MALKSLLNKEQFDKLDKAVQAFYTKAGDDEYTLDVDGSDFKSRLDEFRTNNTKLTKERDEATNHLKKFKDVDPEKYKEAQEALAHINQLEEADLLKKGKLDEVLSRRMAQREQEHKDAIKAATDGRKAAEESANTYLNRLNELVIDVAITRAIGEKASIKKGAHTDVINRARQAFKLDKDGATILAVGPDGKTRYGKKGDEPETVQEYVDRLLTDAPYLFEASQGGGAGGGATSTVVGAGGQSVIKRDNTSPLAVTGKSLADIASGKTVVAPVPAA